MQGDDGDWYAAPPPPPETPQEAAAEYLRTGTVTPPLTRDFVLWWDLINVGLDWRAVTGSPRLPRWRVHLDSCYRALAARIAHERHL